MLSCVFIRCYSWWWPIVLSSSSVYTDCVAGINSPRVCTKLSVNSLRLTLYGLQLVRVRPPIHRFHMASATRKASLLLSVIRQVLLTANSSWCLVAPLVGDRMSISCDRKPVFAAHLLRWLRRCLNISCELNCTAVSSFLQVLVFFL